MTFTRRRIAALIAAIVLAGLAAWWWGRGDAKAAARYQVDAISRGDITQSVSANGTLNPVVLVNVGTQVSGTVQKLFVDFNGRVVKGQPLAKLDDSLLSAQERQSHANYLNAMSALSLAEANARRAQSLFGQGYIPQQEYDGAKQALESATAARDQAKALWDKDSVNLANTLIRSPVSGIVIDRAVDVGQTVAASFQTPTLFKIAQDLAKMQIDTSFAEADIGTIHTGQAVHFTVDAFADRDFSGVVRTIRLNPTTQQNVVTYNVVVDVDNKAQELLPGMTAYVNIAVESRANVLRVPNAALRYRPADSGAASTSGGKKATVEAKTGRKPGSTASGPGGTVGTLYVLERGALRAVEVSTGITDNRWSELLSGDLKPEDKLVTGETGAEPAPGGVRMRMF